MDRRRFLKTAVAGAAGTTGATLLVGNKDISFTPSKPIKQSKFKPDYEYGNVCATDGDAKNPLIWDKLKKVAYDDMLKIVPAEYRYRVQFRTKISDYGRVLSLAWYYPPQGTRPVYCNGKFLCNSEKYLPLPVQSEIGGYGII